MNNIIIQRNKTASFTCQNGYLVLFALQAQIGGDITEITDSAPMNVPVLEYVVPNVGKLTLSYTPVADSIPFIYEANSDLTQGAAYEFGADAANNFSISDKTITLPTAADRTKTFIVCYEREATEGFAIINDSETYAKTAKVIYTILCHESCDMNKKLYTKLVFPRAKIDGNFTFDMSGDAVVQELTINALADVCSVDKTYWTWFVLSSEV